MVCSAVTCFCSFQEPRQNRTTLASWEGHAAGAMSRGSLSCLNGTTCPHLSLKKGWLIIMIVVPLIHHTSLLTNSSVGVLSPCCLSYLSWAEKQSKPSLCSDIIRENLEAWLDLGICGQLHLSNIYILTIYSEPRNTEMMKPEHLAWTLFGRTTLGPMQWGPLCLEDPLWASDGHALLCKEGFCRARKDVYNWSLWPSLLLLNVPGAQHPRISCPNHLQQHKPMPQV